MVLPLIGTTHLPDTGVDSDQIMKQYIKRHQHGIVEEQQSSSIQHACVVCDVLNNALSDLG